MWAADDLCASRISESVSLDEEAPGGAMTPHDAPGSTDFLRSLDSSQNEMSAISLSRAINL